jgi:hypothetical protein
MLGVVGVLPMNINNLFYGSPSGKRKRRGIMANSIVVDKCVQNLENDVTRGLLQVINSVHKNQFLLNILVNLIADTQTLGSG